MDVLDEMLLERAVLFLDLLVEFLLERLRLRIFYRPSPDSSPLKNLYILFAGRRSSFFFFIHFLVFPRRHHLGFCSENAPIYAGAFSLNLGPEGEVMLRGGERMN